MAIQFSNREDGQPLSKSALKKLEKEREKAKKKAEREQKEQEEKVKREASEVDYAAQKYGKLPLNQSQERNCEWGGTSSSFDRLTWRRTE